MRSRRRSGRSLPEFDALEQRTLLAAALTVERNIVYENVGGRVETLDVYEPAGPAPAGGRPVILAIHGGGWRKFSKEEYGPSVAGQFVPAGYVVVAMNYQLSAPGASSWPANIQDVSNAALWVRQHEANLGINPTEIAALGESAGGHLAALLATDPQPTVPTSLPATHLVDAVIDFYGPADLTSLAEQSPIAGKAVAQYLGGSSEQFPALYQLASPVDHVAGGDPPMLLIHGENDHLVPVAQAEELARVLTAAGVPNQLITVPGAHHGMEFTLQGEKLLPQILAFLGASWKDKS